MDAKAWLVHWFESNSQVSAKDIAVNLEKNYFDLGWLDSLQFINLIDSIESEFQLTFSNDQFQDRSFSTINGLAAIIEGQLEANPL